MTLRLSRYEQESRPVTAICLAHPAPCLSAHPSVNDIRLRILDYGNVPRARLITVRRALEIAGKPGDTTGTQTASPVLALWINTEEANVESGNLEDDHWVPEWETLREDAVDPAYSTFLCNVKTTAYPETEWYALDPRIALKRIEKEAKEKCGIEYLIGYEVDYTLLDKPDAEIAIKSRRAMWAISGRDIRLSASSRYLSEL